MNSLFAAPTVGDRFKSPVVTAVAKRQLSFNDQGPSNIVPTSPIRQVLLASPQRNAISVKGAPMGLQNLGNGAKIVIQEEQTSEGSNKPKRTGSLALFFRKVYHLAHLRLDALCQSLSIGDEDVKRKIWTTFEHSMTKHTDLMRDRHLDQLIMCALYIVCKVVGQNRNFTDIMKQYRNQPQAASHVYRSVLLRRREGDSMPADEDKGGKKKMAAPPTPTRLAATSTVALDGEERGDLIKFYNNVFMERMQEFSLKFKRTRSTADAPPLSPLPKLRANPLSPCRKVSDAHSVYIRPLREDIGDAVKFNPSSPNKPLEYRFSRSPAKNLDAINQLMRTEGERRAISKRLLVDDPTQQQQGAAQVVIIQQQDDEGEDQPPPTKLQIVGSGAAVTGRVNARLGAVLGDRHATD